MRTRSEVVTFGHPFVLKSLADAIPAGSYVVETDEEPLPPVLHAAYRRTTTWLTLPSQEGAGATEIVAIDGARCGRMIRQRRRAAAFFGFLRNDIALFAV